jgi:hypothetical protein
MPEVPLEAIELLRVEANRIAEQCLLAAERHYASETPWYGVNYVLGLPSAFLAAVAGATAVQKLGAPEWLPIASGLLAAVLTSLLTFLDPYKRASVHHSTARNYETLYHGASFFGRFEIAQADSDLEGQRTRLLKLNADFNDLLKSSPAIPNHAYRTAAKALKDGRGEVLQFP